ncbi:MAG TPA: NRDE family protein [Dokdonella sp.]|uniref:NRDE family protein n=1 Tax=Dokdonella sp. TaxID=2291710 RepID=UPI002D804358|nr:NRDE family protein [Dokdonella sp.]HET9033910.1 NRDE family protein [Dokdonella sp.]
MCILLIAIDAMPDWPLLLLGNRDEFHARPTATAEPWRGAADCLGGLDLQAGGSWLAQRNDGRFASVTNLRSGIPASAPKSRGALVREFVVGNESAAQFGQCVLDQIDEYGPFNLVFGDRQSVWLIDGGSASLQRLEPGIHVVGNGPFDSAWPKVERLRTRFTKAIRSGDRDDSSLLSLLADTSQPDDTDLPDTGVGENLERLLAPIFIRGEQYGTRASSLVLQHEDGSVFFRERSFGPMGLTTDEVYWECLQIDGEWRLPEER